MLPTETATTARIDDLLREARRGWQRMSPEQARRAQLAGALLVDTRTPWQRADQGELPGALVIDRTVLEWRLDPGGDACIPEAAGGATVIIACRQGYSSSLAARTLRDLGLDATDIVGGVEAWLAAGLPVHRGSVDERR
ncbi:MAG TPA: rhodanese-like domain-containing protein [Jatrophihabitans sp.]|nr:rhodanese-like domain-containing protein [Jatrophihabitans sp.]